MPKSSEAKSQVFSLIPPLICQPPYFLKWAGSKRRLAIQITSRILSYLKPESRYFEPFLGSGAIFLCLRAHGFQGKSYLSDRLLPLVSCFQIIQNSWELLNKELREKEVFYSAWDYYAIRYAFNLCHTLGAQSPVQAARFLYLNHRGFNGLWRSNKNGEYQVPWGGERVGSLPSKKQLQRVSSFLINTSIRACDFEQTIEKAKAGDVIYADPPYWGGFNKYVGRFDKKEQQRLAKSLFLAWKRGVTVIASNRDHPEVRTLYSHPSFEKQTLTLSHTVGGQAKRSQKVKELLLIAQTVSK